MNDNKYKNFSSRRFRRLSAVGKDKSLKDYVDSAKSSIKEYTEKADELYNKPITSEDKEDVLGYIILIAIIVWIFT